MITCGFWLRGNDQSPHVHDSSFIRPLQHHYVEWFLEHSRLLQIHHSTKLCLHEAQVILSAYFMYSTTLLFGALSCDQLLLEYM